MAMLLEELIKSMEMWLKLIKKPQEYIDPNLDPVLLVPGIAGSILNAVDKKTGQTERVWVRILGADHEFCDKLWCRFDPSTGRTENLDPDTSIEVPEDRYGLYAIDNLDPDMIIGSDCVYYYHDMIVEMLSWGYQEGKTLFGFGYDFRQSNRLQETMECFAQKLESIHTASGGKKINIISHSMGGLLVKCFMALHSDIFEKYVKNWIAIAAPFQVLLCTWSPSSSIKIQLISSTLTPGIQKLVLQLTVQCQIKKKGCLCRLISLVHKKNLLLM